MVVDSCVFVPRNAYMTSSSASSHKPTGPSKPTPSGPGRSGRPRRRIYARDHANDAAIQKALFAVLGDAGDAKTNM
jgi:hypothetical protein